MEKSFLTEEDFDTLSWHDNKVYAIYPTDDQACFKLDIDYILEWKQEEYARGFKFVVAPAILSFESVTNLSIQLSWENYVGLYIEEIRRENKHLSPNGKFYGWDYTIVLDTGEIRFTAYGLKQHLTDVPQLLNSQVYERRKQLN